MVTTDQNAPTLPEQRGARSRWLRGLGRGVAVLGVLVVLVVSFLSVPVGRDAALRWAVDTFVPLNDARLEFASAEGWVFRSLTLHDVRLVPTDSTGSADPLVQADTLRASYNLLPLLRSELHLRDARVVAPSVRMHQDTTGTWDLLTVFATDTTAADTSGSDFVIRLDALELRDGRASLTSRTADTSYARTVENLNVRLRNLATGPSFSVMLDTLSADMHAPETVDTVRFAVGASFDAGRFTLSGLDLRSASSNVTGSGAVSLGAATSDTFSDADLRITAAPLAFRDLVVFAPTLDPDETLDFTLTATGSEANLEAVATGSLSSGGRFEVAFEGTPRASGPLTYRMEAELDGIDPQTFAADSPEIGGQVTAEMRVNLSGPSLDMLDGSVRASVSSARLGDYRVRNTSLALLFDEGEADVEIETSLRDAELQLTGTVEPFADEPRFDLDGTVAQLNLQRFAPTAPPTRLAATFTAAGVGLNPATADWYLTTNIQPSMFDQVAELAGQLDAELLAGRANIRLRLTADGGSLAAEGRGNLTGLVDATSNVPVTYTLTTARLANFPAAALAGDTTASRLTGNLTLDGRGLDPTRMRLTSTARLDSAAYGPYVARDVQLSAGLDNGRASVDGQATLNGAALTMEAVAWPFQQPPTVSVQSATFADLDLMRLAPDLDWTTDLNGSLSGQVTGFDPETMVYALTLNLDASQINEQPVESATVELTQERDAPLRYAADFVVPEGRSRLQGTLTPFAEQLAFAVETGEIRALNIGALLGLPDWSSDLNADLSVEGEGTDPATMALTGELRLLPSMINAGRIRSGGANLTLENGLARANVDLTTGTGRTELRGTGRFFEEVPSYSLTGTLDSLNLGAFLPTDTLQTILNAELRAEGRGATFDALTLDAEIMSWGSRFEGLQVDTLDAMVSLEDGYLRVDSLFLASNVLRATARGPIALSDSLGVRTSDLSFEADVANIEPLRNFLGELPIALQDGTVSGSVRGRPGQLSLRARSTLNDVAFNDIRATRVTTRFTADLTPERTLDVGELSMQFDVISVPNFSILSTGIEATVVGDTVQFSSDISVDSRRDGRLSGRVVLREGGSELVLDAINLRLDNDRWALQQDALLSIDDTYSIRNFVLAAGEQQIIIDGTVDLDGEQDLIVTIDRFRTGAVADLLGYPDVGGVLDQAFITLTGPASSPLISGVLYLPELRALGRTVGGVDVSAEYAEQLLTLDAQINHVQDSRFTLRGDLPIDLALQRAPDAPLPEGDVDLTVAADSFSVGWTRAFIDPLLVDALQGFLTANVQVGGTLDDPSLSGTARFFDGLVGLPMLGRDDGLRYRDAQINLTFSDDEIRVDTLSVRSGGRNDVLTGNGVISLSDLTLGSFDLDLKANNFLAIDSREYQGVVDANLELSGSTDAPILNGQVDLIRGDIYLTEENTSETFDPPKLTEEDLRELERYFGLRVSEADTSTFDFYEALRMNLNINMERDVWIRSESNPEMIVQFTGSLDVSKPAYEEMQAFGSIQVLPARSRFKQFGKQFNVQRGNLIFNGPVTDPSLDIEAAYEVPRNDVTIFLIVDGQLDNLDISFESDPAGMELFEMISWVVFNSPPNEGFSLGGEGSPFYNPAIGFALSELTNFIDTVADNRLNISLDVVEITNDANGTILTAGTYLSPRLFFAISYPLSATSSSASESAQSRPTTFTIEWELLEQLILSLANERSDVNVNVRWEYDY